MSYTKSGNHIIFRNMNSGCCIYKANYIRNITCTIYIYFVQQNCSVTNVYKNNC